MKIHIDYVCSIEFIIFNIIFRINVECYILGYFFEMSLMINSRIVSIASR